MNGFISSLVTHSFNYTQIHRLYSAIADLHTFQFTAAHALGFSVSTSRLLATDLSTETSTQITISITPKIFQLHLQYRCTVAHVKSSIHTCKLRTDCKIFSIKTLRELPEICMGHPRCLQDNPSARTTEKTHLPHIVAKSVYRTIVQQRSSRWLHRKPVTWSLPLLRNLATDCLPPMPSYTRYSMFPALILC
jgi:hypothetical protein